MSRDIQFPSMSTLNYFRVKRTWAWSEQDKGPLGPPQNYSIHFSPGDSKTQMLNNSVVVLQEKMRFLPIRKLMSCKKKPLESESTPVKSVHSFSWNSCFHSAQKTGCCGEMKMIGFGPGVLSSISQQPVTLGSHLLDVRESYFH